MNKLFIMNRDNMTLVAGTVKSVREGSGASAGRVVNVKIEGTVWNKEKSVEEVKTLDIAFWNSDDDGKKKLADRVLKAGIKAGNFITALVVLKEDDKATGINFKYSGLWKFPAHDDQKEVNVFVGPVCSLDEHECASGKFVKISMPVKDRDGNTEWHKITLWNNDSAAMADRAKACLKPRADGTKTQAIVSCGESIPYNDNPSYTGFRFELI